jgi:FKBP-type peptidyl-prolyl cis-trans isomerase 2
MVLKKGDFVRITFVGKLKETGEVFDTTNESVAKKHGIYDPKLVFTARPTVIGARHALPGIDKELEGFEVGEKKKIVIQPKDGFGDRDPSKVKVVPLREFKKQGVKPVPGMRIELEDNTGRVQSVDGGRVRIDLNHGLAGKVLEYENKKEEKIRQLFELYIPSVDAQDYDIKIKEKVAEIILPDKLKVDPSAPLGKITAVRDIFTFIDTVDQIVFKEIHNRMPPLKKVKIKKDKKPVGKPKNTKASKNA